MVDKQHINTAYTDTRAKRHTHTWRHEYINVHICMCIYIHTVMCNESYPKVRMQKLPTLLVHIHLLVRTTQNDSKSSSMFSSRGPSSTQYFNTTTERCEPCSALRESRGCSLLRLYLSVRDLGVSENGGTLFWGFLIIRILLFRVLYWDPPFLETPVCFRAVGLY